MPCLQLHPPLNVGPKACGCLLAVHLLHAADLAAAIECAMSAVDDNLLVAIERCLEDLVDDQHAKIAATEATPRLLAVAGDNRTNRDHGHLRPFGANPLHAFVVTA